VRRARDLHYGNNVPTPGGQRFTVTVTVNSQKAVFTVTSLKTMAVK
jgi:c-di-GMP-binding flagellar brake protein YcgR